VTLNLNEDFADKISKILTASWDVRDGQVVPDTDSVALLNGAVRLDATVLFADLAESSKLATDFHQYTAAKIIRIFIYCMCRLVTSHGGTVVSFDGDRIMGVFLGDSKNTQSAKCALKMNYVVTQMIEPAVQNYFASVRQAGFSISHCTGIDTGRILVVRAGQRGSNDLVWVGRAPNPGRQLSYLYFCRSI
jgi:adenylate cyclase